ncbi:MAG: hypothetical protein JSR29_21720 [Nitrospira sp.]|nr:hypothetical protein [Nitrospira sp.]
MALFLFPQVYVAEIDVGFRLVMQLDSGLLEQANAMTATRVVSKVDDPEGSPVDGGWRLQRVVFFLA